MAASSAWSETVFMSADVLGVNSGVPLFTRVREEAVDFGGEGEVAALSRPSPVQEGWPTLSRSTVGGSELDVS